MCDVKETFVVNKSWFELLNVRTDSMVLLTAEITKKEKKARKLRSFHRQRRFVRWSASFSGVLQVKLKKIFRVCLFSSLFGRFAVVVELCG